MNSTTMKVMTSAFISPPMKNVAAGVRWAQALADSLIEGLAPVPPGLLLIAGRLQPSGGRAPPGNLPGGVRCDLGFIAPGRAKTATCARAMRGEGATKGPAGRQRAPGRAPGLLLRHEAEVHAKDPTPSCWGAGPAAELVTLAFLDGTSG